MVPNTPLIGVFWYPSIGEGDRIILRRNHCNNQPTMLSTPEVGQTRSEHIGGRKFLSTREGTAGKDCPIRAIRSTVGQEKGCYPEKNR